MATLAQHVPAIAAGKSGGRIAAGSSTFWNRVAAEASFIAGLVALCAGVLALRMAFVPVALVPRDLALTAVGVAALVAIAAVVGAGLLRKSVAPDV